MDYWISRVGGEGTLPEQVNLSFDFLGLEGQVVNRRQGSAQVAESTEEPKGFLFCSGEPRINRK